MASDRKSIQTNVKKRREERKKKGKERKGGKERGWKTKKINGQLNVLGVDYASFRHKWIQMFKYYQSPSLSPSVFLVLSLPTRFS